MLLIRPMDPQDLEGLHQLVLGSGHGLTSLPKDQEILLERIEKCQRSFQYAKPGKPQGEDYLFAMIDTERDTLVGVSGIFAKIGGFEPIYFYKIKRKQRESAELSVTNEVVTLHLQEIHNGPSEICSLYLHPKYRKSPHGRFLSLSRFLFMADHLDYFEEKVIAEMRGMVDEDGRNPFWEAVGKKFFKIDFTYADYMIMQSKKWIKDLLPDLPIIVNLLPQAAQQVISRVHPNTAPARKILEHEGFQDSGLVAILEPGPILSADKNEIRSIKDSFIVKAGEGEREQTDEMCLVSNCRFKEFRCLCIPLRAERNQTVNLSKDELNLLDIKTGEDIRIVSLK